MPSEKSKIPQKHGQLGEELALTYLQGQGYRILEKNYRKSCGEVDIIAQDKETLVFLEVKARSSTRFGQPSEAVDIKKQRKLCRIAQHYLLNKGLLEHNARFDVISITLGNTTDQPESRKPIIEHIKNAFDYTE